MASFKFSISPCEISILIFNNSMNISEFEPNFLFSFCHFELTFCLFERKKEQSTFTKKKNKVNLKFKRFDQTSEIASHFKCSW